MAIPEGRDAEIIKILEQVVLPSGYTIRTWNETDFPVIAEMSSIEGWHTPSERPNDALAAWITSWPTLVLLHNQKVIGFLRAISDGYVTTYICELLIAKNHRGLGLGSKLINLCHLLCPSARTDLLSTDSADAFYKAVGFKAYQGFRKSDYV
jgi:ribosomal protein S18 acetylase RimI-like enzyme